MNLLFIASVAAVAADPPQSRKLFQRAGYEVLHPARTEPWGRTATRLLTDDGLIVGISCAPSFHDEEPA